MSNLFKRTIVSIFLTLLLPFFIICLPWYIYSFFVLLVLILIIFFEWPKLFSVRSLYFWMMMPIYIVLPFFLIIKMQYIGYNLANLFLVCSVGFHDTGSYIIGKLFGKRKIAPFISPGKTWEGFFGGFIINSFMSFVFFKYFDIKINLLFTVILSLIISFIALMGDLFESYLKRKANIKDTGFFLPGHGGLLDRCDSALFVVYIVYLIKDYIC